MRFFRIGFSVVLVLLGSPGWADSLNAVLVEAAPILPQTGDVELSETTGASSLITGEALTRPGATLAQVLGREAGTQIRQSGGLGSYSSATLRGSSSDQVMVYLDGLLLNDASGGGFNLSNIELMQAEAIEIYRGATPVQLNTASLGGAINIRSKTLSGAPYLRATLEAGSFKTQRMGLLAKGGIGPLDTLISLSVRRSDNDFPFRNDHGTSFNANDDFDDHRNNSEVDQSALLLKLGRVLTPTARQDLSLQYFIKNQNIPDWKNSRSNNAALDTRTVRLQFNHRMDIGLKSPWNTRLGFNISHGSEEYSDLQSRIGLGRQHDLWTRNIFGLNSYWEKVFDSRTFALSADLRQENYHSDDLLNIKPDSQAKRNLLTLALQESLFFQEDQWLVTAALRYQQFDDTFKIINTTITENSLHGDFTHRQANPQLGVKYQLTPQLSLSSNIGRYDRVPSFFELFGDRGLFIGNDELKPESGTNIDLGLDWHSDKAGALLSHPSARISLFYSDVNDAISRVYNARGIGKSVNIEGARIYGLEWDIRSNFYRQLQIQFKGTRQNAENRNPIPAFSGKQLPGQAQQSFSLYLDYQLKNLHFYYEFLSKTQRFYDTANLLPAADQSIHNLGVKYRTKHSELSLAFNNITDDIYEDFNGFPKPGRAIYFTFSYFGEQQP